MSFRIENRLGIAAPVAAVWAVLSDVAAWPQWSAIYPEASGALRIGARLDLVEQLPGQPARPQHPTIVDWVPEAQILWRDQEAMGLIKRTRYFELEALTDNGCILSNGEIFDGFATRYTSYARRRAMKAGFEAFNMALRDRVLAALAPAAVP